MRRHNRWLEGLKGKGVRVAPRRGTWPFSNFAERPGRPPAVGLGRFGISEGRPGRPPAWDFSPGFGRDSRDGSDELPVALTQHPTVELFKNPESHHFRPTPTLKNVGQL